MGNLFDFARLSDYVRAIVDQRTKALAISVSSSTTYLKSLTLDASRFAGVAGDKATISIAQAEIATDKADQTTLLFKNFTSIYLGVQTDDPVKSSLNNDPLASAFYIRRSDLRLRVLTSFSNGLPVYQDASVKADRQSIIDLGTPLFLVLDKSTNQTIKGGVSYEINPAVPDQTLSENNLVVNGRTIFQAITAAKTALTNYINSEISSLSNRLTDAFNTRDRATNVALETFQNRFASGSNSYGYWEIRPGIIEMWGNIVASATSEITVPVNFPLVLPDLSYTISLTPAIINSGVKSDLWNQIIRSSRTVRGFIVQYQSDDDNDRSLNGFDWRIICKVANNYSAPENTYTPPPVDPGDGGGGATP